MLKYFGLRFFKRVFISLNNTQHSPSVNPGAAVPQTPRQAHLPAHVNGETLEVIPFCSHSLFSPI